MRCFVWWLLLAGCLFHSLAEQQVAARKSPKFEVGHFINISDG
jgi:hypothetical protein